MRKTPMVRPPATLTLVNPGVLLRVNSSTARTGALPQGVPGRPALAERLKLPAAPLLVPQIEA